MKVQPDGSSVRNIFEGSFNEGVMGSGKTIFEGGFRFASSAERKKFNSTASSDQGVLGGPSGRDF